MKALLAEALVVSDEVQSWTAIQKWAKVSDIISATSISIPNDGNSFDVTGSNSITLIGAKGVGTQIQLHFTDTSKQYNRWNS